jgi:hypothetical protein
MIVPLNTVSSEEKPLFTETIFKVINQPVIYLVSRRPLSDADFGQTANRPDS